MEHRHHELPPLSPEQDGLMVASGFGFLDADQLHFGGGGVVEPAAAVAVDGDVDDGAWMDELMQLGDELFGDGDGDGAGGDQGGALVDDMVWLQEWEGASPEQPWSYDDDAVSPPSAARGGDPSAARKRRDRSKTIVSERKRRFGMKEKLYELRSLVPNITKMDKASIIADAVEYVKDLQSRARTLREDVAALESRPGLEKKQRREEEEEEEDRRRRRRRTAPQDGGGARVTRVGAAQVGEGRFLVTVECERRDGVAVPLAAAGESLPCLRLESSNLGCSPDAVVSTLTLTVGEDMIVSESMVKVWVMAALLKEGFRPEPTVQMR